MFGAAVAVTPVDEVDLLIAAAIEIALAPFVDDVIAVEVPDTYAAEDVSSAVVDATIELPLIRRVPACNKPVVVVLGGAVATFLSVVVATDVLALKVPAVKPAVLKSPLLELLTVIGPFVELPSWYVPVEVCATFTDLYALLIENFCKSAALVTFTLPLVEES
jgi:hypothetical protein